MANKKVVVAFSGGLDTSYTVMKLTQDGWDVYAACANTGGFSEEQLKKNEENAYKLGAVQYVTLDVTHEYYEKSLKYMIFGNVLRNNCYPISVSSERIFQAIAIARYAKEIGADAIAHGSTGAGNDQIRFDMTFLVMAPGVEIITLTRDKKLTRKEEVDYLNEHGFFADFTKLKYSYNVGIWGTSICGGELLDPTQGLPEDAYLKHVTAKEQESLLKIQFEKGEIVAVNGEHFDDKVKAIQKIEEIGASYAIGRDANVGDTIIGIKGRVGFEAAAPKLIIEAHRLLEKSTLSKWQQYWKDQVANWYGMFLHESQYLEPVMPDMEAMLTSSQRNVTGTSILKLRPYGFETVGIDSENDLTKSKLGEYGETQTGWTADEAKGFIKVSSTPLRVYYGIHKDEKTPTPTLPEGRGIIMRINDGNYNTASPDRYLLLKDFAQKNKQFPTDAERVLWEYLRAKQLSVKFNRQHIIGDYIVDFVCIEKKLVIEVDGGYHSEYEQIEKDENRTQHLNDRGFNVIRFKNEDILRDISNVLKIIRINLNNRNE